MTEIAIKEHEFTTAAQSAIATAHSLEIRDMDDLHVASDLMSGFKSAKKSVEDFFKPMKDSAFQAHRAICDREKVLLAPYADADKTIKSKVTTYNAEQRRLAEIKAAELRAKQEAEAQRLMDEAVKAESDGDNSAAESLLKQAEITETINTPTIQTEKVTGISYRTTYSVEVTHMEAVPCELNGAVIRPVDISAIKKLAQITKGAISIPGIKITVNKEAYSR